MLGVNPVVIGVSDPPNMEVLALLAELDCDIPAATSAASSICSLTLVRLAAADAFWTLEPVGSALVPAVTGVKLSENFGRVTEGDEAAILSLRPLPRADESSCPADHDAVPTNKNGIRQSIRKILGCML